MKFFEILKDVATTKVYAARTYSEDPLQSFRFRVWINGELIGFKSVSGLSREVEVIEYLEGMFDYAHKLPGRETTGEVSFERGLYKNGSLEDKYKQIFNVNGSRFDVTIGILDKSGTEYAKTIRLYDCWFSNYELSDLDAESSDVIIESLTLQFEHF